MLSTNKDKNRQNHKLHIKNYYAGLLVERLIGIILGGGGGTNATFEDDILGSGFVWERRLIVGIWDDWDIWLVPVDWVSLEVGEAIITWEWLTVDGVALNWEDVDNWEWLKVDGVALNWEWLIEDGVVVNWEDVDNWEWLTVDVAGTTWFISGGKEELVIGKCITFCRGGSVDCSNWIL